MSRFSLRREVTFGLGVYALYLLVARLVLRHDGRVRARRNAERIVAVEERLRIDVEPAVQRTLLRYPRLVHGLNLGYGLFNVTLTVGWLVVLYRRRDERFHRFRRACLLTHLGAQPVFLLFPTAPPRVLDGFVDTLSEVSGLDLEHPLLLRFYNPVAAKPLGRPPRASRPSGRGRATTTPSTGSPELRSARPRGGSRESA